MAAKTHTVTMTKEKDTKNKIKFSNPSDKKDAYYLSKENAKKLGVEDKITLEVRAG